ncbi:uncharacterized protein LOC144100351 [Amblyomma americanum]
MSPFIYVFALLLPTAIETRCTKCLKATVPDILDIGKCLGNCLDLCNATVTNIIAVLVKLLQCLITALLKLNVDGAVAAFLEIIEIVLSVLGIDLTKIKGVVKPMCCVSNVSGCKKVITRSPVCKKPITVTLPKNLNLEKCFTDTLLLCKEGDLVTDELLAKLVKALACVLKTLLGTHPGSRINGLACAIRSLLQTVSANVSLAIKNVLLSVVAFISASCKCA